MAELTKEWLKQTIAEYEANRDELPFGLDTNSAIELQAFKLALASLEAEAVAYLTKSRCMTEVITEHSFGGDTASMHRCAKHSNWIPLFTAPPAPVSVMDEAQSRELFEKNCMANIERNKWHPDLYAHLPAREQWAAWEACRAAMLQGAEPVTTAYKLPANTPCKEAPEHIWLQTAGVWPDNGEFSELTWCSDNQHKDDTLYVRADVVTGNSPVIPDGYALVPVEPTYQMCEAMGMPWERPRFPDRYKAMLAAAPQQEVTQALAKGMERYGDAMQELAKKEEK